MIPQTPQRQPQQQPGLVPQQRGADLKNVKDIIRVLVTLTNEKVKNFYVYRVSEPADLKAELIGFMDNFAELYFNSIELLLLKNTTAELRGLATLCESWIAMERYDMDVGVGEIFQDGIELYRRYLRELAKSTLYEAV